MSENTPGWHSIDYAPHDRRILVKSESGEIYAAHWVCDPFSGDEAYCVSEGPDGTQHLVRPVEWRDIETTAPDQSAEIERLRDQVRRLSEALGKTIQPLELYRAYGWPDRLGVIDGAEAALAAVREPAEPLTLDKQCAVCRVEEKPDAALCRKCQDETPEFSRLLRAMGSPAGEVGE